MGFLFYFYVFLLFNWQKSITTRQADHVYSLLMQLSICFIRIDVTWLYCLISIVISFNCLKMYNNIYIYCVFVMFSGHQSKK